MKLTILYIVLSTVSVLGQSVRGRISEQVNSQHLPLVGANVHWLKTTNGTTTDSLGQFTIAPSATSNKLVVSYVGYHSDTLTIIDPSQELLVTLRSESTLREVTVSGGSTQIDQLNPIHTEILTTRTLAKAACCNLSETFETNASVSVSYADAVTGAKQIQFLGLGGQYVQTNVENIPTIRGLGTTFGLNFVPGTWITSIDVGKGVGSVVNGYEGMTGALNVELQKPDYRAETKKAQWLLNGYTNSFGRVEGNLNFSKALTDKWSVGVLGHASALRTKIDQNGDNFLDLPLYRQYNAINRWKYTGDRWMAQFGIKALYEDRDGGEVAQQRTNSVYRFTNTTKRIEAFSKTARLFPDKPYKGLGLILNALQHEQQATFGFKPYSGQQRSLYANLIYQTIINNTNHAVKTGISYLLDDYYEVLGNSPVPTNRTESVPGLFAEYAYTASEHVALVLGNRVDFHNLYGVQWTPRVHGKYHWHEMLTVRFSAGRGWRVPNPLAENFGYLVSSRNVLFRDKLKPEISWNMGGSLTYEFLVLGRKGTFVTDYYRTDFRNQLVVDLDHPGEINFYNLTGPSYANSFQAELNYTPIKRMEVKAAYRLFDVRQSLGAPLGESVLLERMMISRDRLLLNAGYALPYDKWKFDATLQWNGPKRIPYTAPGYEHTSYRTMPISITPGFVNLNAQVSKAFRTGWEVYLGGENLTGFRQLNPIMGASDPFGRNFDAAAHVWGPITGRVIYLGFRFKPQT